MDEKPAALNIVYSPAALDELDEISSHNARRYGVAHAISYINFLQDGIDQLADDPSAGKAVEGFPGRLAKTMKRSARGNGHTAIYEVDAEAEAINILHVYHTSQDATGRMERER